MGQNRYDFNLFFCYVIWLCYVMILDRLAGTINFERKKKPAEKLNEWSSTVDNLMDLLNKATHCIQKEEMIHALKV